MRNHTHNLYRVTNLSDLDFSYRIVDIELPFVAGKEGLYNKQVKKIAQQVSSLTGGPAAMIKRNGKFCIAIPSDRQLEDAKIDVAPFTATVKMLDGINQIDSSCITKSNCGIIEKFLDFEIRKQLSNNKDLWKLNSNQFFRKVPLVSNEGVHQKVWEIMPPPGLYQDPALI